MKQNIVIFTGVSGVGKTSILKELAEKFPIQLLTAGQLIMEEIDRHHGQTIDYDELRTLDIAANQKALKAGFDRSRDTDKDTIFLDAHVVVDTPSGLQPVSATLFESVGATFMIFFEHEPKRIFENRLRDPFRNRPPRDIETLDRQQRCAKENAEIIANELRIPFFILQCGSADDLIRMLEPEGVFHACQTGRP